jgi:DNA-binding CsgD family transcriptional regulator/tetratricopeptide (TPR) repeat protein
VRLVDAAEPVALAVAVLGPGARLDDIAALAGRGAEEIAAVLDELVSSETLSIDEDFGFAFCSPEAARSLCAGAGPVRLGLLHGRAARRLIGRGAPGDEVAAHLMQSPPAGRAAHAVLLRRAAAREIGRGDWPGAVRLLRRAHAEAPGAAEQRQIKIELGVALAQVDVAEAVETLRAAVAESRPGPSRAHASEQLGRTLLVHAGRTGESVAAFTAALADLPAAHPRRQAVELLRANAQREHSGDATGAVAERSEGSAGMGERALNTVMRAPAMAIGDAVTLARQALQDPELLAIDGPAVAAAYAATSALMWCGEHAEALAALDRLVAQAVARNAPAAEATARYCRARARLAGGEVAGAFSDAERVRAFERQGFTTRQRLNQAVLAATLLERGATREAAEVLGAERGGDDPEDAETLFWLMAAGMVACEQGRPVDARHRFERAGRLATGAGCENQAVVPWRSAVALTYRATVELGPARELIDDELTRLRAFGGPPGAIARALRIRSGLGGGLDGRCDLQEARALVSSADAGLERIHTLLAVGRAQRAGGERAAAIDTLRSALDHAGAGGALRAEREARAELSALGVRPRRAALTGVAALTPAEHRVAGLVAAGNTNREVARAVVVSPRTVEHHLTKIFSKLGISGRDELPAALRVGG